MYEPEQNQPTMTTRRRSKRDRNPTRHPPVKQQQQPQPPHKRKPRKIKKDEKTIHDHIITILPSLIGLAVGSLALMAKLGFRGRATVAGIDLGTTNSVICVQTPSKGVGRIDCIPDPLTASPIIPSVVSFTPGGGGQSRSRIPSHVVGAAAKDRMESHPHSTVYHAKRIIGREYRHPAVDDLRTEVPVPIVSNNTSPLFQVQIPLPEDDGHGSRPSAGAFSSAILPSADASTTTSTRTHLLSPQSVGSLVLTHLLSLTSQYLRHSSVTTAVIAIPAEFSMEQRVATLEAYSLAGIKVQRVLEEPTAAALAYGLDEKEGVEYVLVYDFGGGTLDVSLLRMGLDGFVDVMGSAGDNALGGADFDAVVSRFLMEREESVVEPVSVVMDVYEGKQEDDLVSVCAGAGVMEASLCTSSAFHAMAERMKIRLSDVDNDMVSETCLTVSEEFMAAISKAATSSQTSLPPIEQVCHHFIPKSISLTRNEFNTLSQPLFDRAVLPIRNVLEEQDMSKEDIDEVVMVGGTTRMPHIRELVKQELGIEKLNVEIDPDLTVAYGAASVID